MSRGTPPVWGLFSTISSDSAIFGPAAAYIIGMTATITNLNRQPSGVPIGGQFAPHPHTADTIELQVNPYDTFRPMPAGETKSFIEAGLVNIDLAWMDEDAADTNVEDAIAGGKAHAHAEMIAYSLSKPSEMVGADFEAQGERILNDRREGFSMEQEKTWTGPGAFTAVRRQQIVEYCRNRADEMFAAADKAEVPDVAGHFYGRYEAFSEIALDLSGEHVHFTGE